MTDSTAIIAALERIAARAATEPDPAERLVGQAILSWLAGDSEEFNRALGLGLPGQRSLRTRRTLQQRDALLRPVLSWSSCTTGRLKDRRRPGPLQGQRMGAEDMAADMIREGPDPNQARACIEAVRRLRSRAWTH